MSKWLSFHCWFVKCFAFTIHYSVFVSLLLYLIKIKHKQTNPIEWTKRWRNYTFNVIESKWGSWDFTVFFFKFEHVMTPKSKHCIVFMFSNSSNLKILLCGLHWDFDTGLTIHFTHSIANTLFLCWLLNKTSRFIILFWGGLFSVKSSHHFNYLCYGICLVQTNFKRFITDSSLFRFAFGPCSIAKL